MDRMRRTVLALAWYLAMGLSGCAGRPKVNCEIHFAPESRLV